MSCAATCAAARPAKARGDAQGLRRQRESKSRKGCAWSNGVSPSQHRAIVALSVGETGEVERERLVCFDTENKPRLAGGVGTRAFMIGSAQWRDGELVVRPTLSDRSRR
jgi:hypothetical protein